MSGTVTRVRKKGVEVEMNPPPVEGTNYNVIRQSDGSIAGVVVLWKNTRGGLFNLNWVGDPPTVDVQPGDTIQ